MKSSRRDRTAAEKLLDAVRRQPSPTCKDVRQLDLIEYIVDKRKREAFTELDKNIAAELEKASR